MDKNKQKTNPNAPGQKQQPQKQNPFPNKPQNPQQNPQKKPGSNW